jgi:hypothetical protein
MKGYEEFDSSVNASRQYPICMRQGLSDPYFVESTNNQVDCQMKWVLQVMEAVLERQSGGGRRESREVLGLSRWWIYRVSVVAWNMASVRLNWVNPWYE